MNHEADNLERLLSELPDDTLAENEIATAKQAVTDDPIAEECARQYDRLATLLRRWRTLPEGIDWEQTAQVIVRQVSKEAVQQAIPSDSEDTAFDALVRGQGTPLPPVDWDGLKSRISAAVHEEAKAERAALLAAPRRRTGWFRWAAAGTPLAAAAALVLAVWWPRGEGVVPKPITPTERGALIAVSVERPQPAGRVFVSFVESPAPGAADEDDGLGGFAYARGPARGEFVDPVNGGLF